jgi:hypothetical protein
LKTRLYDFTEAMDAARSTARAAADAPAHADPRVAPVLLPKPKVIDLADILRRSEAVTSPTSATMAHQIWFWAKPCT